jgi:chloramphenicol 3-O phosphotransferase
MVKSAFVRHTYYLVAVTCALHALEAREKARGDRPLGQARGQFERVLQNATYDMYLDTGLLSVEDCVDRMVTLVANGTKT